MDYGKKEEIIEKGYRIAKKKLPQWLRYRHDLAVLNKGSGLSFTSSPGDKGGLGMKRSRSTSRLSLKRENNLSSESSLSFNVRGVQRKQRAGSSPALSLLKTSSSMDQLPAFASASSTKSTSSSGGKKVG